jgi:hypothetical protein
MYCFGNGVEKDLTKAAEWYRKAAEQGDADGQRRLGNMYKFGNGVEQDLTKAAEWYRKAAEQGNAEGQCLLGIMYEFGNGVEKDLTKAAEWYRKAAEQGDAEGQWRLGNMYYFGDGVEKEFLEAKARERGLERVRFCGILPHEQVAPLLAAAKISYIPLKNSNMKDSVPTKLYESLAMGCPVLLAAAGDAVDVLEECGLGCSVSPDQTGEIIGKFDDMVARYDEICQNRQNAMEIIRQKHSRQSAVTELDRQLRILCGGMKERVNV